MCVVDCLVDVRPAQPVIPKHSHQRLPLRRKERVQLGAYLGLHPRRAPLSGQMHAFVHDIVVPLVVAVQVALESKRLKP